MKLGTLLILCSAILNGCSTPAFVKTAADWVIPEGEKLQWKSLRIEPQPNANQNSALALDLVLALDLITADKLEALTGAQWHQQRESLLVTYAGQVVLRKFELTPGNGLRVLEDDLPQARASRVLVFANLRGEALGRLRLSPKSRTVLIEVGEAELGLRTDPPARP